MAEIQLNHLIVFCTDQQRSASFLTRILGLPDSTTFGPFLVVELGNGVSMDFDQVDWSFEPQHYAFLVADDDFDQIYGRIRDEALDHWADPGRTQAGEINHHDGGRGVYFPDPDNHLLEIITRPYGSG